MKTIILGIDNAIEELSGWKKEFAERFAEQMQFDLDYKDGDKVKFVVEDAYIKAIAVYPDKDTYQIVYQSEYMHQNGEGPHLVYIDKEDLT